jgi:hypothetical protein
MSSVIKRIWQHVSPKRILVVSGFITIAAFMLLFFLASLGDSDLPPYTPPFPGEHLAWKVLAVVVWPLVVVAGLSGRDPPFPLWFPLTFVAGIFWALVIETFIVIRHVRRA